MVAGILGFKNVTTSGGKVVYIVPTGKIAVVNIFASAENNTGIGISIGGAAGMDSTGALIDASLGTSVHTQHKGIVLQAGAYVIFSPYTTGIVTGFEEDA